MPGAQRPFKQPSHNAASSLPHGLVVSTNDLLGYCGMHSPSTPEFNRPFSLLYSCLGSLDHLDVEQGGARRRSPWGSMLTGHSILVSSGCNTYNYIMETGHIPGAVKKQMVTLGEIQSHPSYRNPGQEQSNVTCVLQPVHRYYIWYMPLSLRRPELQHHPLPHQMVGRFASCCTTAGWSAVMPSMNSNFSVPIKA